MLIKISNEADGITVAGILFKNGYTVRNVKRKEGNKTVIYLEAIDKDKEGEQ